MRECTVESCHRTDIKALGLCSPHHKRLKKTGDVRADEPIAKRRGWQTQPDQCLVETCERPARRWGYCETHSSRVLLHGDPLGDVPIKPQMRYGPTCSLDGCERPHDELGYCTMHAQRVRAHGDPGEVQSRRMPRDGSPCLVDGCERPVHTKGYCDSHYRRWYAHGDPLGGRPVKAPRPDVPDGYKWCSRCEIVQSLDNNFGFDSNTNDGRAYWCKRCYMDSQLIVMYNVNLDWYEETFAEQGGHCATCPNEIDPNERVSRMAVDHDHACCPGAKSCGKCVRGILCSPCNHALGNVNDTIAILANMIDYLTFHHERREQYGRGELSFEDIG